MKSVYKIPYGCNLLGVGGRKIRMLNLPLILKIEAPEGGAGAHMNVTRITIRLSFI